MFFGSSSPSRATVSKHSKDDERALHQGGHPLCSCVVPATVKTYPEFTATVTATDPANLVPPGPGKAAIERELARVTPCQANPLRLRIRRLGVRIPPSAPALKPTSMALDVGFSRPATLFLTCRRWSRVVARGQVGRQLV